jgi:protein TonB
VVQPIVNADYLNNPAPVYPSIAQRLRQEGRVLLRVLIEPDGRASRVEVLQTSGFQVLDQTAVAAVKRWRFVPGKRGGTPEAMWAQVPLEFKLDR